MQQRHVTVWLSAEAIAAWTPGRSGRRGGQRRYSDLAIETALTLRLLYHLPLRQAEGFLHALFGMLRLDLSAPDSTTGCVATFQKRQESDWSSRPGSVSCRHLEQVVDELNLSPHIRTAHPPRLPLPDHVHGLVALDRSPRRVEFTKALLGLNASFSRAMIMLHDGVQVLNWPVAATASRGTGRAGRDTLAGC